MAMPKVLQQMRQSLKNTGKNVITDGSIGLQDSDTGAHFNLEIQSADSNTVSASFENDNNINVKLKNIADPTDLNDAATKNYVDIKAGSIDTSTLLPKSGGTMTGPLTLANDPAADMQAATKQYVDNSGGIFYITYGDTNVTFQDVTNAYNQGKQVIVIFNSKELHPMFSIDSSQATFGTKNPYYGLYSSRYIRLASDNQWSTVTYQDVQGHWTFGSGATMYYIKSSGNDSSSPISSTTRYYRPILASIQPPSATDGKVGDLWVVYKNA